MIIITIISGAPLIIVTIFIDHMLGTVHDSK